MESLMESIMPVLVALYFVATVVGAIIKKARTPPRPVRPVGRPATLDEDAGMPDARTEPRVGGRPEFERPDVGSYDIQLEEPEEIEPVYEWSAADEAAEGAQPPGSPAFEDSPALAAEPASAGASPGGEARPAPRAAAVQTRPTGERPVVQVRKLLTPDSLAQAVLLKEILGPPRALNPYRLPALRARGRE